MLRLYERLVSPGGTAALGCGSAHTQQHWHSPYHHELSCFTDIQICQ